MVAERGFDGGNVLVRDADFVSKRAKDGIGFVERGKGAIAEAFAVRLELFEDVEARTKLSLLAEQAIKVLADLGLFSLNFAESGLALLDGAAAGFDGKLVGLDVGGEFLEPGFEAGALFIELDFFGGKLFESHDVALLLKVEGIDLVAEPGDLLRSGKAGSLRGAELLLALAKVGLDLVKGLVL